MALPVVAYLVTGIAMPVLPIYVHQGLGLGTFVVGLVAGARFAATLLSRQAAEVITHLAFYAGWPNAMSAVPVAKDVFDKRPR